MECYVNPIKDFMNWTLTCVTIAFSITICPLDLSAARIGKFVEKNAPKVPVIIAAVLFALGAVGSGLAFLWV